MKQAIYLRQSRRAAEFRKDSCELCGATSRLAVHHADRDRDNNEPRNITTLCGSCHARIHWQEGKAPKPTTCGTCRICGERGYAKGYCRIHYLHFKTYGDPEHYEKKRNNGLCSIKSCTRSAYCKTLCMMHYTRERRKAKCHS